MDWRIRDREASLANRLDRRRDDEQQRLTANLDRFAATQRDKLAGEPEEDLLTWLKNPKELPRRGRTGALSRLGSAIRQMMRYVPRRAE
ncbi:MAG: hypothetical protein ACRDT2_01020 [Natronosporangium sp.]